MQLLERTVRQLPHLCRRRLVCLFLKRGADYNARDKNDKDPITIAVDNANADIVTLWVVESQEVKRTMTPRKHFLPHSLSLFQASNCKDEQGDAGDGRIIWPIRSFKRAGLGGVSGCGCRWAGPSQEESPGNKEPHQWLGAGRPEWLMRGDIVLLF